MLKKTLALIGLTLSLSTNAAILSLDSSFGPDTITRDTTTGLDWLDVTVTRNLSYNQVTAQLGSGGTYEGYRYATMAELDQLILGFGYVAVNQGCANTALHCDIGLAESELVEYMIITLGDTYDANADLAGYNYDVDPSGAGYTMGMLGSNNINVSGIDTAFIDDRQIVHRVDGLFWENRADRVQTAFSTRSPSAGDPNLGSFLVAPSAVPIPTAAWLFGSGLLGLVGVARHKRK